MNSATVDRLVSSFKLLAPRGEELVDRFFSRLFAENPAVRHMFPDTMADQKKKLLSSLVLIMERLGQPEQIVEPLRQMGERHAGYGVKLRHFPIFRDTLMFTMQEMLGRQWNPQLTRDWAEALDHIMSIMREGAERAGHGRKAA